jgi:deoxyribodipyrimidine photo-lyase
VKRVRAAVPELRIRAASERPVDSGHAGEYVLYWMIAARRTGWSFGLERALEHARALALPLLVLEPLRAGYPWASDRLHRFVLDGMALHARELAARGIAYHPYVEPEAGAGKGLLAFLAERAAVVVTDDFPAFFLPRMVAAAARGVSSRVEAVDSNGLVPLCATEAAFATAFAFRRWLQRELPPHLARFPAADPLADAGLPALAELPAGLERRWPAASAALLAGAPDALASLHIDHSVGVVPLRGGAEEGRIEIDAFVRHKLARYAERRSHPDDEATSGLSAYLHFGHVSPHECFAAVALAEGWRSARLTGKRDGRRGWYGMSAPAEEFLDQLVTWRELGFVFAHHRPDHDGYESLPDWARATLEEHARPDDPALALDVLERAATGDPVWNAAQTELLRTGKLHNYRRMLWGKKILEWSPSPREALARLIHLNNKYALDGRDPNSYSGIFWCLGRFDRPWAPKRPRFGSVRWMSSDSARRKLDLDEYLARFGPRDRAAPGLFGDEPRARQRRRS